MANANVQRVLEMVHESPTLAMQLTFEFGATDPSFGIEMFRLYFEGDRRLNDDCILDPLPRVMKDEWLDQVVDIAFRRVEKLNKSISERLHAGLSKLTGIRPDAFHPLLDQYFRFTLEDNRAHNLETGQYQRLATPWRGAPTEAITKLFELVRSDDQHQRRFAWHAMIQTLDRDALHHAWELDGHKKSGYDTFSFWNRMIEAGVEHHGWKENKVSLRPLHTSAHMFMKFPFGFQSEDKSNDELTYAKVIREFHPAECFEPVIKDVPFGGSVESTCGVCRQSLHHLLTLKPIPEFLRSDVQSVDCLKLVTCLSCVGWEDSPMYFVHRDRLHAPEPWAVRTITKEPQFPAHPFKETTFGLGGAEARYDEHDSFATENMARIGGRPAWVQTAQYPECLGGCGKRMKFIAQMGGDWPIANDRWFMFGSGGTLYMFWCDECQMSANSWQCT